MGGGDDPAPPRRGQAQQAVSPVPAGSALTKELSRSATQPARKRGKGVMIGALIGATRPAAVVASALLFGALRAGATPMQSATDTPIDIVVIIQALVIMFIAAPALVRAIYRIRTERTLGTEVFAKGWGS